MVNGEEGENINKQTPMYKYIIINKCINKYTISI
jgi:hypothetical protein